MAHYLLKYKKRDFKLLIYWHLDITKQKTLKKLFYGQNLALINRADKILGATPKHINESEFTPQFGNKKAILPYAIDEKRLVISGEEIAMAVEIRKNMRAKFWASLLGGMCPIRGSNI